MLRGDVMLECYEKDFFWKYVRVPLWYSDDDPKRPEMMKTVYEVALPNFLRHLDRRLTMYPEDKFLCSSKITVYDLFVGGFFLNVALNPKAHFATEWKSCYDEHASKRVQQYISDL